jgi:RNA polymerase sigma-70 factor (ECF subfamily)
MTPEESEIVSLLKKGEESGLKMMFDRYYKPLSIYTFRYVNSLDEAEDIVQDLFVRFWDEKRIDSLKGSLKAYLFNSVRNASLNLLRQKNRLSMNSLEAMEGHPVYEEVDHEEMEFMVQKLRRAIEQLSPRSREVFKAIVLEDLKYKEVASALGISVNTVKTLFSRSLKNLRKSTDAIIFIMLF